MRIVLLGATGFVGHHLLPSLSAAGHECVALSRYKPGCRDLTLIPRVQVRQCDVHDAEGLRAAFSGADCVINMVGILNESGRSGKGFRKAHVDLNRSVIDACRSAGVSRFLYVSALHAGQGRSHYLKSKGEAEDLIRAAEDIDSTIVQPSVIFGAGDSFFNRFAALLKWAPVLPLACPDARMQPVWVGDVSRGIVRALADPGTIGKTLVMVGPEAFTLRELVAFTARAAGLKRVIVGLPDALSRLQAAVMDFVPGKPFSTDNYLSLQTDNTSDDNSLPSLGIRPRPIHCVISECLSHTLRQRRLDALRQQPGR
ncbi:MAG: complex I NDUFA9 subunit family protein [Lysobacterales bacterium]|jgi:NADH dehydrogenase